jgi:hypothetical protein
VNLRFKKNQKLQFIKVYLSVTPTLLLSFLLVISSGFVSQSLFFVKNKKGFPTSLNKFICMNKRNNKYNEKQMIMCSSHFVGGLLNDVIYSFFKKKVKKIVRIQCLKIHQFIKLSYVTLRCFVASQLR